MKPPIRTAKQGIDVRPEERLACFCQRGSDRIAKCVLQLAIRHREVLVHVHPYGFLAERRQVPANILQTEKNRSLQQVLGENLRGHSGFAFYRGTPSLAFREHVIHRIVAGRTF